MITYQISIDKDIVFPKRCICCLKTTNPDEIYTHELNLPEKGELLSKKFEILICPYCLKHWQKTKNHQRLLAGAFGLLLFAAIGAMGSFEELMKTHGFFIALLAGVLFVSVLGGIILLIFLILRPRIKNSEDHVNARETLLDFKSNTKKGENSIVLTFGNSSYADQFLKENNLVIYYEKDGNKFLCDNTTNNDYDTHTIDKKIKMIISKYAKIIDNEGVYFAPDIPIEQIQKVKKKFKENIQDIEILFVYMGFLTKFIITNKSIHISDSGSVSHIPLTTFYDVISKKKLLPKIYFRKQDNTDNFYNMLNEIIELFN